MAFVAEGILNFGPALTVRFYNENAFTFLEFKCSGIHGRIFFKAIAGLGQKNDIRQFCFCLFRGNPESGFGHRSGEEIVRQNQADFQLISAFLQTFAQFASPN